MKAIAVFAVASPCLIWAQAAERFDPGQSDQGKAAYARNCAGCHGVNLDDGQFAPPLKGPEFVSKWAGKTAAALFEKVTAMPPAGKNSLGAAYVPITDFLLVSNGVTAAGEFASVSIPAGAPRRREGPGGGISPFATLPPAPEMANPLDRFTPVTDAMLRNPPATDWLTWRRTWDDQGFSPLKQINRGNVGTLQVAWSWSLPPGANESTPLVHDGVIFVHSYGDNVQALDAASGNLLWQYSRKLPEGVNPSVKRNIAIYGDKVYVGTSDVHLVALNAKTGKVVWDSEVADHKIPRMMLTGGPLAAKGKVMIGTAGQAPGGNFIVAFDAESGKEAWRFHSIAQPGDPGGNSWNGLPAEKRNGASVWTAGSYDPALNLAFFGPAQT